MFSPDVLASFGRITEARAEDYVTTAYALSRYLAALRAGDAPAESAYYYARRAAFIRELTRDYDPALVQDAYGWLCRKYYDFHRIQIDEFPAWVWVLRYAVEIPRQVHLPYSPPPPESYEALLEAQFSGYGDFTDNQAFL
jgi:hypothetical protein